MGTTDGNTGRTGNTTFAVQPAFVLVGVPGIGKTKIADALARDEFTERLGVMDSLPSGLVGVALGLSADYRTELHIATERAIRLHSTERATMYTHSLIDSLAYTLVRLDTLVTQNVGSEQTRETWALTMGVIGIMLRDTFKSDETFFLHADFEKDSDEDKLQEVYESILQAFEVNYVTINVKDFDTATDDVARIIEGHFG